MIWGRRKDRENNHQYVEERLSAYLDGALSSRERTAVEQHLATCPSCQWQLDTLRLTVQWTRELPAVRLPRAFTIPAPAQVVPSSGRRWNLMPALQGATAVVALLFVLVVAGDFFMSSHLTSPAPEASLLSQPAPASTRAASEPEMVESQPIVVEVTREVELAVEAPAAEVEAPAEKLLAQPTALPAPAEPFVAEEAQPEAGEKEAVAVAPAAPEGSDVSATGATAGGETGATPTWEPTAGPPSPTPEPVAEGVGSEAEPGEGAGLVADEAEPTSRVTPVRQPPSPTPAAPALAAPTVVAEVQEAAVAETTERDERLAEAPRRAALNWLRLAELGLGLVFVVLGTTTFIAMFRRRRAG